MKLIESVGFYVQMQNIFYIILYHCHNNIFSVTIYFYRNNFGKQYY